MLTKRCYLKKYSKLNKMNILKDEDILLELPKTRKFSISNKRSKPETSTQLKQLVKIYTLKVAYASQHSAESTQRVIKHYCKQPCVNMNISCFDYQHINTNISLIVAAVIADNGSAQLTPSVLMNTHKLANIVHGIQRYLAVKTSEHNQRNYV